MDKYVNTSDFDINSFDAERITARENQEKAAKFYQDPNIIAKQEAKRNEEIKHAESLRRMQAADNLSFANKRDEERFRKQETLKDEQRIEQERDQKYQEHLEKIKATKAAYERYKQHSPFYRMFHKNVYKMDRSGMSVDEINNLYGGKSK